MFRNALPWLFVILNMNGILLDRSRLDLTLHALEKGLQFMEDNIDKINLDAVLGTRFVEEQLQAYLKFEPYVFEDISLKVEELRDKAAYISDEGKKHVNVNEPEYSASVGNTMDRSKKLLWYPSRLISRQNMVKPLPCSMYSFNENASDSCLREVVGSEYRNIEACSISEICQERNVEPQQRGYFTTHQVLYWQLIEMRDCMKTVSPSLQTYLCSNVMRDSEEIAQASFPRDHQDLFMEQIGLCGMWGFKDFYKPEWLDKILEWQYPSGCFANRSKWHCADRLAPDTMTRVKRREKILDDGCLSHKTTVALLAITVSLRFEAERVYYFEN